ESHAASFALLVYKSAWLKAYYPAHFLCALLNSQPMGFYSPASLVKDAQKHGVEVRPVCVLTSEWDCTLERVEASAGAVCDGEPVRSESSTPAGVPSKSPRAPAIEGVCRRFAVRLG